MKSYFAKAINIKFNCSFLLGATGKNLEIECFAPNAKIKNNSADMFVRVVKSFIVFNVTL